MTRGHRGSLLLRCRTFSCPFSKPAYPGAPQPPPFSRGPLGVACRSMHVVLLGFHGGSPGVWCSWLVVVHQPTTRSGESQMRAFPVSLPSGARYWTVLDLSLIHISEPTRLGMI